jgi:hypothetical protein
MKFKRILYCSLEIEKSQIYVTTNELVQAVSGFELYIFHEWEY